MDFTAYVDERETLGRKMFGLNDNDCETARSIGLFIIDSLRFAATLTACTILFNGWMAFIAFVLAWIAGNVLTMVTAEHTAKAAEKVGFVVLDAAHWIESRFSK